MKRRIALIVGFACLVSLSYANDKDTYLGLLKAGKMPELKAHLDGWAARTPDDPEMCIGFYNYYLNMARSERMVLGGKTPPKRGAFMTITDSATGETHGYLYGEVKYDPAYAEEALKVINTALRAYPDRLDMHFGKARLLAELHAYGLQRDALLKAIDIKESIGGRWAWSDGEPLLDGDRVFVQSVHDYVSEWLGSGDKVAFGCVQPVCERLVAAYPKEVIGYNDLALYYAQSGDLAKAESYFLAAHALDESDYVVVGNLAYLYKVKGDTAKAIAYFERMTASSDPACAEYARRQIKELHK